MTRQTLPLDQQLCFALYSANHVMGRLYRPLLAKLGLTYPQYLVMLALWEKDNQPVGALGQALALETNTLTPLLKRMEGAGFLTRTRNPEDERSVSICLSEKGRALEVDAVDVGLCVSAAAGDDPGAIDLLREEIKALTERLKSAS
ncbi:MarR family winged helix-turn-helix transcriptional regulator [Epibacterium ulvae]|uniref:Transcriptional regulator, MarR family n=1 Tax=Epibacterium ulvae TaxID=1156985 RepID=A0A1G5QW75_9RHOB|nr:MarR family transcriptional regulator [Epibacterium ulvae]SCZ65501.1 transcriptional regulator, MarR family [Epibacterium ulvae]